MIMGDRVVSKLDHTEALGYATLLARRMIDLFAELRPSVIIGGFDAIHGSLAVAVARYMDIPWFALHFSVIPPGLACFCDRISPAARVPMTGSPIGDVTELAEVALQKFEGRSIQAPAYIAPPPLPLVGKIAQTPARLRKLVRTLRRSRSRESRKFTESEGAYSVSAAVARLRRMTVARNAIATVNTHSVAPAAPVRVLRSAFSARVVDRRLGAVLQQSNVGHRAAVAPHPADTQVAGQGTQERYRQLFDGATAAHVCFSRSGARAAFADTRSFIENAELVISIQGTIGLEAALLGKPVIALGDSPISIFPSVSRIGSIPDLPTLVREKLLEARPSRSQIVRAYASYLAPFMPASHNDWTAAVSEQSIEGYVKLFRALRQHVEGIQSTALQSAS